MPVSLFLLAMVAALQYITNTQSSLQYSTNWTVQQNNVEETIIGWLIKHHKAGYIIAVQLCIWLKNTANKSGCKLLTLYSEKSYEKLLAVPVAVMYKENCSSSCRTEKCRTTGN